MQTLDLLDSLCSARDKTQAAADLEFPSPTTDILSVGGVFTPDADPTTSHPTSLASPTISDAIPRPPAPVSSMSETPTPLLEIVPELGLSGLVAGSVILPNSSSALPSSQIPKAARNLRLPSFDLLGIAAPHPDRIAPINHQPTPFVGAGPLSQPEDPLHLLKSPFAEETPVSRSLTGAPQTGQNSPALQSRANSIPSISSDQVLPSHKNVQQYILTTTPPDDNGNIDWTTSSDIKTATLGSSDQGSTPMSIPISSHSAPSTTATSVETSGLPENLQAGDPQNSPCLRDIVPFILSAFEDGGNSSGRVTIMSHALPLPSSNGHAFPMIINSIHEQTFGRSTVWINVYHAVPGSINLADLPTSPPTTPAPPNEGLDYFTTKVFDSAVIVPDYQGESNIAIPSPRPVVAPSSVDVTIVERYIPPTSEREFSELFFASGHSILSDRLVELSPKNGILVFIYPTRRGGITFQNEYLSPVLEPILRAIMVAENMPSAVISELAAMHAIRELSSFEEMRARLEEFCRQLSTSATTPLDRFHHMPATYNVIYASKQEVTLPREVWAKDWWNKQEKPRIRKLVSQYHTNSRQNDDTSPPFRGTELVERLMERVATGKRSIKGDSTLGGTGSAVTTPASESVRPLSREIEQPSHATTLPPIEVAVFVVKKSAGQGSSTMG